MFINQYPYTDVHELNLDYILKKVAELDKRIDDIKVEFLQEANAYTDQKILEQTRYIDAAVATVNNTAAGLERDFENLQNYVDGQVSALNHQIDVLYDDIAANVQAVNARTDVLIQANNEYLFRELGTMLSQATVINYFTGDETTIQNMFDYLASFHLSDSINYNQLYAKNNTYTQLMGYNMTYTQLVNSGNIIIT